MNEVLQIIRQLESAGENPKETIRKSMAQSGKKAIGCFPIYAPEELVYSAGFLPIGMWGGPKNGTLSDRYLQTFCCSIMKANTELALSGSYDMLSGIILTAYCDTMKCIMENWKMALPHLRLIPMVYPQNRKAASGVAFMEEEFTRVKAQLEELRGSQITEKELTEAVDCYDDYRRTMQQFTKLASRHPAIFTARRRHAVIKAASFMDKRVYTEKMKQIICGLEKLEPEVTDHKRIILTGLMAEPAEVLDLLEENRLFVAADDLAQETRQFSIIAPKKGSAIERMAQRIAMQDGCSFLYDAEKSRGSRLIQLKNQYNTDAIIFCQLKFCDPDEFDYPIIKKQLEAAEIPLLHIELEQQMESLGQIRTRLQGFAEILE